MLTAVTKLSISNREDSLWVSGTRQINPYIGGLELEVAREDKSVERERHPAQAAELLPSRLRHRYLVAHLSRNALPFDQPILHLRH